VALAWLGMFAHNMADLPSLRFSGAENVIPGRSELRESRSRAAAA
jgi:hypothetical protein